MTPEQLRQLEDTQRQLRDLKEWKASLEASYSIPLNIDQAFRDRLSSSLSIVSSSKSATSENQAVNEGGVATYNVLKPPDAFKQVVIGSTIFYIPVYT